MRFAGVVDNEAAAFFRAATGLKKARRSDDAAAIAECRDDLDLMSEFCERPAVRRACASALAEDIVLSSAIAEIG